MRDTIYRDEAVEICERWRQRAKKHHDRNGWYMADILLRFMKRLPSADRPQGEWELECDGEGECDNLYRCPFCGNRVGCKAYDKPKFCDECGADLKGADDGSR